LDFNVKLSLRFTELPDIGGLQKLQSFSKQFYLWTRDLHLYFGLAISPFILLFAISVIFLNHPWIPLGGRPMRQSTAPVQMPAGLEHLEGMARVEKVKEIMRQLGIGGEVSYIRPKDGYLIVPVQKPGKEITLNLSLQSNTATIQERDTGIWDAMDYLHKSPGPHLGNIRGNWVYTRVWKRTVDLVVYLLLFISASGIYLWAVLKAERKVGMIILGAGVISFMGVVYVLI